MTLDDAAAVAALIRARAREWQATARAAMTYTSGAWTVVPGGSMVDIDATDIAIGDGAVVNPGTWDSIIHTASDPFVAEHIVGFRPPVILAAAAAILAAVDLHDGPHQCPDRSPNGEDDPAGYFGTEPCPTLRNLRAMVITTTERTTL